MTTSFFGPHLQYFFTEHLCNQKCASPQHDNQLPRYVPAVASVLTETHANGASSSAYGRRGCGSYRGIPR